MLRQQVTTEKTIGGVKFYLRPYGAFTSANLSGDVLSLVTPLFASVASVAAGSFKDSATSFLDNDIDIETIAPALSQGLSGINGDKLERILKKLLVVHKNISVEQDGKAVLLTEDLANEVFCGEAQDMFILAFEVIRVNFPGIFKKLTDRFGAGLSNIMGMFLSSGNTEN